VVAVELRDGQIEVCEGEAAVDLQGLTERVGGRVVVVLLELRDADVVGPIRALEPIA
jgi:hypothetical protein